MRPGLRRAGKQGRCSERWRSCPFLFWTASEQQQQLFSHINIVLQYFPKIFETKLLRGRVWVFRSILTESPCAELLSRINLNLIFSKKRFFCPFLTITYISFLRSSYFSHKFEQRLIALIWLARTASQQVNSFLVVPFCSPLLALELNSFLSRFCFELIVRVTSLKLPL